MDIYPIDDPAGKGEEYRVKEEYDECENVTQEGTIFLGATKVECEMETTQSDESVPSNSSLKEGHTCPICRRIYPRTDILLEHLIACRGPISGYCCDVCGQHFSHKNDLTEHEKLHTYPCQVCDRVFPARRNLLMHLKAHSLIKKFQCKTCGREFSRKNNYDNHLRKHSDEKPFKCRTCGKCFTMDRTLKIHIRSHLWRNIL